MIVLALILFVGASTFVGFEAGREIKMTAVQATHARTAANRTTVNN